MNFILESPKDRQSFIVNLTETFPEIRPEVLDEDWAGLIHLQVGCFMRLTQAAIDKNDGELAQKCFQFVEDVIDHVEFDIENALVVSWIEHLNFSKNENLYLIFPPKLKEIKIKIGEYFNTPSTNESVNTFLKNLQENVR